jgi:hypothetical protein
MGNTKIFLFLYMASTYGFGQTANRHNAFISVQGTLGLHTIAFKDFAKSSGVSFGYLVSAGIYAVQKPKYHGGLQFTLLEAASRNPNRRQISEDFTLPKPSFDKHIIFNFAQFRSGNIGWFQNYQLKPKCLIYHLIGFGVFGTTEKDQLLDFGMHNQLGLIWGKQNGFCLKTGLVLDQTFGTGNPNYLQHNIGLSLGGSRAF